VRRRDQQPVVGQGARQRAPVLNGIVAGALLLMFALLSFGIGEEIYRCDILRETNCD
jgi:hypothetical protein